MNKISTFKGASEVGVLHTHISERVQKASSAYMKGTIDEVTKGK